MLILTRREQQAIVFPGLGIRIVILEKNRAGTRLGIDAPHDVQIVREELLPCVAVDESQKEA